MQNKHAPASCVSCSPPCRGAFAFRPNREHGPGPYSCSNGQRWRRGAIGHGLALSGRTDKPPAVYALKLAESEAGGTPWSWWAPRSPPARGRGALPRLESPGPRLERAPGFARDARLSFRLPSGYERDGERWRQVAIGRPCTERQTDKLAAIGGADLPSQKSAGRPSWWAPRSPWPGGFGNLPDPVGRDVP